MSTAPFEENCFEEFDDAVFDDVNQPEQATQSSPSIPAVAPAAAPPASAASASPSIPVMRLAKGSPSVAGTQPAHVSQLSASAACMSGSATNAQQTVAPRRVAQQRRQPPPTIKARKATVAGTACTNSPQVALDFNAMIAEIKASAPSVKQFVDSPVIKTFIWLLRNIHAKTVKVPPAQRKTGCEEIMELNESNMKGFLQSLYEKFSYIFVVNSLKRSVDGKGGVKASVNGQKYKSGKDTLFQFPDDEFKQFTKDYSKLLTTLVCNIDEGLLKGDLAIEFILQPINATINAYDLGKNSDFGNFTWVFDTSAPVEIDSEIDEKKLNIMYKELFSQSVFKKPSQVFKRRASFVDTIPYESIGGLIDATIAAIDEYVVNGLPNDSEVLLEDPSGKKPTKDSVRRVAECIKHMLETETFRRILFKGIQPNKLLERALEKIFEGKEFALLLEKTVLQNIQYLFSCRSFGTNEINNRHGELAKMTITKRRSELIDAMLSTEGVSDLKNKELWVYYVIDSEVDNPWQRRHDETEKKVKKGPAKAAAAKSATASSAASAARMSGPDTNAATVSAPKRKVAQPPAPAPVQQQPPAAVPSPAPSVPEQTVAAEAEEAAENDEWEGDSFEI